MYSYNTTVPPFHDPTQPFMAPPQTMVPMQHTMVPAPFPVMSQPLMAPTQLMVPMQPAMVPAPYPAMPQPHDHIGFVPMANQPMMAPMPMQPMMCHHPGPMAPMAAPPPPPQMVPTQYQPMPQPPMPFAPMDQSIMAPMSMMYHQPVPLAPMVVPPPPQMVPTHCQPLPPPQMFMVPMENQGVMASMQHPMIVNNRPPMPLPPPHMAPVQYQFMPPPHLAPIGHNQQMMVPNGFVQQQAPIHHNAMTPQPEYMEQCPQPVMVPCMFQPPPMDSFMTSEQVPTPRPDFIPMNHGFVTLPPPLPTHQPDSFHLRGVSQPIDFGSPPPAYDTCPPSPIPPPPGFTPLSYPPLIRPYSPLPGADGSSDYSDDLYEDLDCPTSNDEAPASIPSYYSGDLTEDGDTAFLEPPFDSNSNTALHSPTPSSNYSDDLIEDADTAFLRPPSDSCPSTPPRDSSLFSNLATASSSTPSYVSGGCTFYLPASSMDSDSSPSTSSSTSSASTALSPYAQSTSSYNENEENDYDHDVNELADYLGTSPTSTEATALLSNDADNEDLGSEDALENTDIDEFAYESDPDALAEYLGCNLQISDQEGFEQDDLSEDCPSARAPSTTSIEDDDDSDLASSHCSSSSSSSIVRLSSSGSESVDEDAISVSSYASSRSFQRGGCTFYPPPPTSSATSDSESDSGDIDEVDPLPLDDVQQLLQPSSAHSILRQFRPASQRDVVSTALSEEEANAYYYASFNRPVGQPQFAFTMEEIDEMVANQLRMGREPANPAV